MKFSEVVEGFKWSLSHTKNISCCVVIDDRSYPQIQSVGVDIEKSNRSIPNILHEKFIRRDEYTHLSELEIWCIKEAAFKAISKIYFETFDLIDIKLTQKNFELIKLDSTRIFGAFEFWYSDGYIISGASVSS